MTLNDYVITDEVNADVAQSLAKYYHIPVAPHHPAQPAPRHAVQVFDWDSLAPEARLEMVIEEKGSGKLYRKPQGARESCGFEDD
jgi:hypothetical protein